MTVFFHNLRGDAAIYKGADIALIGRNLLDDAGTQIGILQIGCQKYGVNIGCNHTIGLRNLQLVPAVRVPSPVHPFHDST